MNGSGRSAGVVKLADTLDLGSSDTRHKFKQLDRGGVGSSANWGMLCADICCMSIFDSNILISKTES